MLKYEENMNTNIITVTTQSCMTYEYMVTYKRPKLASIKIFKAMILTKIISLIMFIN